MARCGGNDLGLLFTDSIGRQKNTMTEEIVVEPMTEDFILWCCIHSGPLSCDTIDQWSPDDKMPILMTSFLMTGGEWL